MYVRTYLSTNIDSTPWHYAALHYIIYNLQCETLTNSVDSCIMNLTCNCRVYDKFSCNAALLTDIDSDLMLWARVVKS